jgi:hypothetical protein
MNKLLKMTSIWSHLSSAVTAYPAATIATIGTLAASTLVFAGCYASEVWPEKIDERRKKHLENIAGMTSGHYEFRKDIESFKTGTSREQLSLSVLSELRVAQRCVDEGYARACHVRKILENNRISIKSVVPGCPLMDKAGASSVASFVHDWYKKQK